MPDKTYKYPWKEDPDFIRAHEEERKIREDNLNPFEELKLRLNSNHFMAYYNEELDAQICWGCEFGKQRTAYYPKFQHKDKCSMNKYRDLINSIGDMIA